MQAALIPQASPDAYGITNVLPRSATALACPTGVMAGELQQDHCSWMGGEMVRFGKSAAVRAPPWSAHGVATMSAEQRHERCFNIHSCLTVSRCACMLCLRAEAPLVAACHLGRSIHDV